MNNILYKISLSLILASSLVSCKKYLDINDNPNNTLSADPTSLFVFATTSYVNNRAGGDLYIPTSLGTQVISSGGNSSNGGTSWGAGSEDQYVFSPFSFGNIWTQYYTSVGANLKAAINLCDSPPEGVLPNPNGAAQSKVILAQTFYELAVLYGDVPFSEAFNDKEFPQPNFDSQKDVLDGAIALIDEALEQFDEDSDLRFDGQIDMFYGTKANNITQWIKAAKSIKLRILMTMVDADPSKEALIGDMIEAGGFISSANDNMALPFENVAGKKNPKFAIKEQYLDGEVDFFYASPYVYDYMAGTNDPRIPFYFETPDGSDNYVPVQPGANANDAVNAKLNNNLHYANQPEYVFTYQEQLFYEAEIYARGLGVEVDLGIANDKYKEAIRQSALFIGVEAQDASDFVTALPALTAAPDPLYNINYEHWIDKMDRGIDAFTQWRRSGPEGSEVPLLDIPANAPEGGLFRRYEYPATAETAANPNSPETLDFRVKTWFDL